jgi:hypothetical protein
MGSSTRWGTVELITFLQDRFGVAAADDEITEDNFATLRRIASFVTGKRSAVVDGGATARVMPASTV